MIGFFGTPFQLQSIITAYNQWLRLPPFRTGLRVSSLLRDSLGSDLRVGHSFSFRCPLVNTPQLNTELVNCLLSSLTSGWINSRINYLSRIEITASNSSSIFGVCPLLRNVCQFCSNAFISTSVSVAADTRFSEPLSSNGLFRISGVMSQYIFNVKCSRFWQGADQFELGALILS
jgi:hypothetical protein